MLTKSRALEKLQKQASLVEQLKSKSKGSPDFKKWHRDTEIVIENTFGSTTRHLKDFNSISYSLAAWSSSTTNHEFHEAYVRGLNQALAVVESFIDEVVEYWDDSPDLINNVSALAQVVKLCQRFHIVSRQLRSRHNARTTIEVEDEYDVQDLMHALLLLHFDDVRREDWTPSYAGGSSRVDFLLKDEGLVIEVKKTRKGLEAKHIGEQLSIDIIKYKSHPECKNLICFVYDPEGRISNPRGLESDLNGDHKGIQVLVIIAPSGI